MRGVVLGIVSMLIFMSMLMAFGVQSWRISYSSSVNRYIYDIVSMGETYTIVIETDGAVSGLRYNNYSFSIAWETYGTFENVTLPKSLNGTNIKVVYHIMFQGWDSRPQIYANETHYIITGPDQDGFGHITEVYFGSPIVQVDLSAQTVVLGYYVNITGMVSYRGKPVNDVGVRLSWSSGGLPNEISTVVPSPGRNFPCELDSYSHRHILCMCPTNNLSMAR